MAELPPTHELFERYGAMVYRRCAAILRSDEAARDAVQEVFLRVIERRRQFRGDSAPGTWLYAIATLHCLQQLRDHAGRSAKLAQLAEQPPDKPARSPEEHHAIAKLLDGESAASSQLPGAVKPPPVIEFPFELAGT
jgi:RNA polymerase sigma-70 factor (ECF subfamily)